MFGGGEVSSELRLTALPQVAALLSHCLDLVLEEFLPRAQIALSRLQVSDLLLQERDLLLKGGLLLQQSTAIALLLLLGLLLACLCLTHLREEGLSLGLPRGDCLTVRLLDCLSVQVGLLDASEE